jgi:pSer/pThr/pTyr-binding forkhead associated (FHA) protein
MPAAVAAPASRALLVGGGKRLVLSGERMTLGRSRDCDLVLDDPNVSRRHAELRITDEGWTIADLGSTNGIKVGGRRVAKARLSPGDEVTVGLTRLSFELE